MDNEIEKTIRTLMMRSTPRPLLYFDVEIVEHCNLNCKSCASMSCLAEEEFLDIEEYERDINRLSILANGEMHHINILGGEPLLHPNVCEFLYLTRKSFPHGIIHLITNGLLLNKQNDDFWKSLRDSDITLAPTRYPVKVDYDIFENRARDEGVKYRLFGSQLQDGYWFHPTMDLSGWRNENHSFLHCWQANNCAVLDHGKIYPCPVVPNIRHFNKRFGTDLHVSEQDSIDIYQVDTVEQIMRFLAHAVPFCRYCNTFQNRQCSWALSKKEIGEWT